MHVSNHGREGSSDIPQRSMKNDKAFDYSDPLRTNMRWYVVANFYRWTFLYSLTTTFLILLIELHVIVAHGKKIATTSPSLVSTGSIRRQKRLYGLPWRVRGAVSVYWGPTRTGDCARNSLSATRLFVPVVIVVVGGAGGGGGAIGGGGTVDGGWC